AFQGREKSPFLPYGDFALPSFPRPCRSGSQLREESAFGMLHTLRGFGVAAGSGDALEDGNRKSGTQVLRGVGQGQQRFQRGLVAVVDVARAAFLVEGEVGLGAGAMVVEIRIEVGSVELLEGRGVGGRDVAVAHVFADDGALFGFDQSVVVAVAGAGFWSV